MADSDVDLYLKDLQRSNPNHYEIVQRLRLLAMVVVVDYSERIMYGGIMVTGMIDFCGFFSSKKHVSIEFVRGCDLIDHNGVMEGTGKTRRHIKVRDLVDVEEKQVKYYIQQAYANAIP